LLRQLRDCGLDVGEPVNFGLDNVYGKFCSCSFTRLLEDRKHDAFRLRRDFLEQLQPFCADGRLHLSEASYNTTRVCHVLDEPLANWIMNRQEYYRCCFGRTMWRHYCFACIC